MFDAPARTNDGVEQAGRCLRDSTPVLGRGVIAVSTCRCASSAPVFAAAHGTSFANLSSADSICSKRSFAMKDKDLDRKIDVDDRDANLDPITGAPGSNPVGTGV